MATDNQNKTALIPTKNKPSKKSNGISGLFNKTAQQFINPKNYTPHNLHTQWQRSKRVMGLTHTLKKGMGYAYSINRDIEPNNQKRIALIQKFCQQACRALKVEVIALEPIPQHHALWTSNHISWLDIPTIGSIIPTFFLSKAEIGKWPLIGFLARAANTLFIERGSGDADSVSKQMAQFLKDGYPVVFFPEATTTDGTAVKRIHGKLLQAAMDANVPIQPIVICYVDEQGGLDTAIPYYGDITMADSLKMVLDNNPAKAYVLPLKAIDPAGKSKAELTEILQNRMNEGLQKLHSLVVKKL